MKREMEILLASRSTCNESEGNAKLFESAPELLAALERVTNQLQHLHPDDEAWVQARQAIAKATGGKL